MKRLYPSIIILITLLSVYQSSNAQCLTLVGSDESALEGESTCIDITAREFQDIGYYQYSLSYDHEAIRFDSIINVVFPTVGEVSLDRPMPGLINISWDKFSNAPFSAPPDIVLYQLCFTAVGDPGEQAVIRFTNTAMKLIAEDVDNNELNFAGLSASINISDNKSPLRITNACPEDLNCETGQGGLIDISVANSGSASFSWSGPNNFTSGNEDIFGELNGTYSVEVTDTLGNTAAGIFTIDLLNPVEIIQATITDAQCAGVEDGSIDISPSGGAGQYSYLWSNGDTTQDLSNIGAGTYSVIVLDEQGCQTDSTFTVIDLGTLEVCGVNVSCETSFGNDGSIDLSICGGDPPYEISWSNGAMVEDLTGLEAGLYTATITDATDCRIVSSPIEVCSSNFDPDEACFTVMAVPNTAPTGNQICVDILTNNFTDITSLQMSMTWNKNILELADVTNFGVPNMSEDNFNKSIAIDENGPLIMVWDDPMVQGVTVDEETVMFQLCFNITGNNGTFSPITFTNSPIVIEATGKVDDMVDIVPVQTINGSVTVGNSSNPLKVTLSCAKEPDCFGTQAGQVDIIVTGGVPPYTYEWNTGSTEQDIDNLFAGDYSVTVSDANNSTTEFSVTLQGFEAIILNSSTDTVLCRDGRLDLFVNAPNATTIQWTPANILSCTDCPTPQATITEDVTIQVEVIDDMGCTESREIKVNRSDSLVIQNLEIIDTMTMPPAYRVEFEISGGNVGSYIVTGLPGTLTGKKFVSDNIDAELPYIFTVEDASMCNSSTIKGPGIIPCETYDNCVWPGDANANGEVDHLDILHLGLAFGKNGPDRVLTDNQWIGHYAEDWPGSSPVTLVNNKHADANGSGSVDDSDRIAILNNYGENNNFGITDLPSPNGTTITLGIEDGEFNPGEDALLNVFMGTNSQPANDIYAVAFTVQLNTFFIAPGTSFMTFDDSWLKDGNQSLVTLQKIRNNNRLDVAISRKDGQPLSGKGAIAQLHFTLRQDIFNGQSADTLPLAIGLNNILFIDEEENWFTAIPDPSNSLVIDNTISVYESDISKSINLYPNPTSGNIRLEANNLVMNQIILFSKEGKKLNSWQANSQSFPLALEQLNPGFYLLEVYTDRGVGMKRFVKTN